MTPRNLLTRPQVAKKLGRSPNWFVTHRPALEAQGFPPPRIALNDKRSASELWDETAIDRFLDGEPETPPALDDDRWTRTLTKRLEQQEPLTHGPN